MYQISDCKIIGLRGVETQAPRSGVGASGF